jgi:hypothetical protein
MAEANSINSLQKEEEEIFFGCKLKFIKKITGSQSVSGDIKGKKIIVSTNYFPSSNFSLGNENRNVISYITELLKNIESFQTKIDKYTRPGNTWIYRVYLDNIIYKFDEILVNLQSKTNVNNSNTYISTIIKNLQLNQHIFTNLIGFLKKYIEKIIELSKKENSKYKNIEIITYENENIYSKLKSEPTKIIAGHIETFGTIMRLHPLISEDVDFCIMRNCSNSFTPLDIKIQDYWINERTEILMDYLIPTYGFELDFIAKHKAVEYGIIAADKIFNIRRLLGGLASYRNNPENRDILITKINDFSRDINNKIINKKNNAKYGIYKYGIDELILSKIFNDIIKTSFHIKLFENTIFEDYNIYSKYDNIRDQYGNKLRYMSVVDDNIDTISIDNISLGSILRCIEFKKFPKFIFSEDDNKKIKAVENDYWLSDNKINLIDVDISGGIDSYEKAVEDFQSIFKELNIYPILFLPSNLIVYFNNKNENNEEISKYIIQKITPTEMKKQSNPKPKESYLIKSEPFSLLLNPNSAMMRRMQRGRTTGQSSAPPIQQAQAVQQTQLTGGNKYIKKTMKYKTNKKHKSHSRKYKNKKTLKTI